MTAVTVWLAPVRTIVVGSGESAVSHIATPWQGHASSPALWQRAWHLVASTTHRASRGAGSATILRLRDTVIDGGVAHPPPTIPLTPGGWIAICHGEGTAAGVLDPSQVDWWGAIADIDEQPVAGAPDAIGTIRAVSAIEHLRGQRLHGWAWRPDPETVYGTVFSSPPTANLSTRAGVIVGNAIAGTDDTREPTELQAQHLFARHPSEVSLTSADAIWTRWRLLKHLLAYCWQSSAALPPIGLPVARAETTHPIQALLDDTTDREVYDLRAMTYDGALDMLIPEVLGLDWHLDLVLRGGALEWDLAITLTATEAPTTAHPAAKATAVDLSAADLAGWVIDQAQAQATRYDAVRIVGAPIVWAFTVGQDDDNLQRGWSAAQETAYATPAGDLSEAQITARRNMPDVAPVGRRFSIEGGKTIYELRTQIEPISGSADLAGTQGYAGDIISAIPLIRRRPGATTPLGDESPLYEVGPGNAQIPGLFAAETTSATPYLPTAALLPDLPLPKGVLPGVTDDRPLEARARIEYLPPRIYYYDEGGTIEWTDLLSPLRPETPRLSFPGGGLIVEISYGAHEYLLHGLSSWSGQLYPVLDWRHLVLTIAAESDQRLEAYRLRAEGLLPVRTLEIHRPDLALWCLRSGSILGLDEDGAPIRPAFDLCTRNDAPAIDRLADLVAAWAFRARIPATLHSLDPLASAAWISLGTVLGTANDGGATRRWNSPIRSISRSYLGAIGTTVATEAPATPPGSPQALAPGAATISPSSSGPIAWDLSGTVPQALQALSHEHQAQARDGRDRLIMPPRTVEQQTYLVRVGGGQGTDNLVLARPTNKPTALAVYDPSATPPSGLPWPNGIGWGDMLLPNGSTQRVLLALWSTAPSTISTAIYAGTVVAVQEQVAITGTDLDPQMMWVPRHV